VSPRTPRLSSKEMIKLLEREGFAVIHTRGSHCKLRKGERAERVVPLNRDPLRVGTQTDILAKARISI
jgi:predicted RNA binding protein YcfA (HicA-like mRNA interferase family)